MKTETKVPTSRTQKIRINGQTCRGISVFISEETHKALGHAAIDGGISRSALADAVIRKALGLKAAETA